MGKRRKFDTTWLAPIFGVLSILAIWLSLTYLPLASWGISITADDLWLYMPWVVVLIVGLSVLVHVYRRN